MRTGDTDIDNALDLLDERVTRLRDRVDDLQPDEKETLAKVTGEYLPTLLSKYLQMPREYREMELSTGGTPRTALAQSLQLVNALLLRAEERIYGTLAASLVLEQKALADHVAVVSERSDTSIEAVSFEPPSRIKVALEGAFMVTVGFILLAVLTFFVVSLVIS